MVRGRALIDSRLDTAKICSDKRVHVDHAQLPAVFGGEKTFSHGLGHLRTIPASALPLRTDIDLLARTGILASWMTRLCPYHWPEKGNHLRSSRRRSCRSE